MSTGLQVLKTQLAEGVLKAVQEFEATSGLRVLSLDVEMLKREKSDITAAVKTSE